MESKMEFIRQHRLFSLYTVLVLIIVLVAVFAPYLAMLSVYDWQSISIPPHLIKALAIITNADLDESGLTVNMLSPKNTEPISTP